MCHACPDALDRLLAADPAQIDVLERFMANGTLQTMGHPEPFKSLKLEAARPGAWLSAVVHGGQGEQAQANECEPFMMGWARLDKLTFEHIK